MKLRLLGVLCLTYLALLVYASLMPFDLTAGWDAATANLDGAWLFWPINDVRHTSRADLLSNLLLYVPLGMLLATRWRVPGRRTRRGRDASDRVRRTRRSGSLQVAAIGAGVIAALVSTGVEAAQLFSWSRTASVQDVLMNASGGLAGGIGGAIWGRAAWLRGRRGMRRRLRERPIGLAAFVLALCLAADGLSPFLPTLDVSQVKRNVRHSHVRLSAGLAEHPLHHWLVERVAMFAVLAAVCGAASRRRGVRRWARGAMFAIALAGGLEVCKPFIVGRSANSASVATAAVGAVLGAMIGAALCGRLSRRAGAVLALVLLVGYAGYLEWQPFTFAWIPSAARAKLPAGAAWLPLFHYARGARVEDVFLFLRTLVLLGAAGYAACAAGLWGQASSRQRIVRAALTAGAIGLLFELGQFLLPGRYPTTTDVFCFAAGGALGAWLFGRWAVTGRRGNAHSLRPEADPGIG